MAEIKTIELADGSKRYRFVLDVGRHPATGKRQQRTYTFRRMRDARDERARLTGAVGDGKFVDRSRETVSEALDRYLRSACFERADNTKVGYAGALLPVRERLGNRKLQSITRADIESLRDWMLTKGRKRGGKLGTPLGAVSVRQTLSRLRAALEMGCEDGRLAVNPARYIRLPSVPQRDSSTWSEDEANRFLAAAAADRLHACWRLSALGERRGEVLGERWDDLDLDAGTITVNRSRVLVAGQVVEKCPKSRRGTRTLPLDAVTLAALRALRKRQLAERLAAGRAYTDTGYVAVDELGEPLSPHAYSREFARLCQLAGVPAIRLHDARHSVNSLLARRGVPPHIRALWLGHSAEINQTTYTHAQAADLAMITDAIGDIYTAV